MCVLVFGRKIIVQKRFWLVIDLLLQKTVFVEMAKIRNVNYFAFQTSLPTLFPNTLWQASCRVYLKRAILFYIK